MRPRHARQPAPPKLPDVPAGADPGRERRARALEEPLDVTIRPGAPYVRLRVRNPLHQTVYQVMAPAYPDRSPAFCSCEDFSRRGLGTCKHLEASWIWLSEHPESAKPIPAPFDGAPLWEAIDRRLTERQAVPLSARSIRAPGLPLVGR